MSTPDPTITEMKKKFITYLLTSTILHQKHHMLGLKQLELRVRQNPLHICKYDSAVQITTLQKYKM